MTERLIQILQVELNRAYEGAHPAVWRVLKRYFDFKAEKVLDENERIKAKTSRLSHRERLFVAKFCQIAQQKYEAENRE